MNIVMHCGGMPFNGDTVKTESLGGSETAAYALAKEMVARGHQVALFTNHPEGGVFDGVRYEWAGQPTEAHPMGEVFHGYATRSPHDVLICQRAPVAFRETYNSKLNLLWLHDLALARQREEFNSVMWNVDKVLAVSEWHKKQIEETMALPGDTVGVSRNGVYLDEFPEQGERVPYSLLFSSRPERGLEELVKPGGIMEGLAKEKEPYHLNVCAYDNVAKHMVGYYQMLWQRCEELPNVTLLGSLTKPDLYKQMSKTWLHIYPSTFKETSCITAMETQAAGLPILASATGALPETLDGAGARLLPLKEGEVDPSAFLTEIKRLARSPQEWAKLAGKTNCRNRYDWTNAAELLEEELEGLFRKTSENEDRLVKHFYRNSDIVAAEGLTAKHPDRAKYPHLEGMEEYCEFYEADQRREIDSLMKKSGVGLAETLALNHERLEGQQRFVNLVSHMEMHRDFLEGKTVLDFGCAYGHYTQALARRFPEVDFVGVDITRCNVGAAKEWAKYEKVKNVTFYHNSEVPELEEVGLLILGEVVEHVPNPQDFANTVLDIHKPDLVWLSVPTGPVEMVGVDKDPSIGERAHLSHLERADLRDMFGAFPQYRLVNIFLTHTQRGEAVGESIVTFENDGREVGKIDLERKLFHQAPEQTLSLCMIAKDAEDSIARAIKSVGDLASEVWVAIDESTTDRTEEVCHRLGAKTFTIPSPLEIGFSEARNLSIEKATSDWVMWLDCDEEFVGKDRVRKYLRNNCVAGYGIKQHHFTTEPAGLMKTDLPVRIFRNGRGVQFFGEVHEHPETAMNEGLGWVSTLSDVAISHPAYADEQTRKKRFQRNLPLMRRDREKNPDRLLGKFLWLRDCVYQVRDLMAENVPPDYVQPFIEEADLMFTALLKAEETRYAIDGLEFYSNLNEMLGRGFNFGTEVQSVSPAGIEKKLRFSGRFRDEGQVRILLDRTVDIGLSSLQEEYA